MTRKNLIKNSVGLVLVVGVGLCVRSCFPPSERSVVRRFERHRESFETILGMMQADPNLAGVATFGVRDAGSPRWCQPEELSFPRERYLAYRALLRRAGVASVVRYDDEICFYIAASGFGTHGWRLALVHRPTEPDNVVVELCRFKPDGSSANRNDAYRAIGEDWYIWIAW